MIALMTKSLPEIRRLRARGINVGELRQPRAFSRTQHDLPWACDNDGYQGVDVPRFMKMLGTVASQEGCLFVVAPDFVGRAKETLGAFLRWEPIIRDCGLPLAYALQDGLMGVGVPWDLTDALFIGGTTEFKMSPMVARTVTEAKERGLWVHMGRVNTLRRMEYAASIGCDSIDGTKWSRFTDTYAHQLFGLDYRQGALAQEGT